jgi:hypothetical protein
MIQTIGVPNVVIMILFLSLEHLIFEFVSNFEIRYSNFCQRRKSTKCPLSLYQSWVLWTRVFTHSSVTSPARKSDRSESH